MLILRRRYEILLIAGVVLALFYPMIFAAENSVDDWKNLQARSNSEFDLFQMFKPKGGFYYRPLTNLTFWADRFLWDQDLGFMHLENILLHLLNALLVYFIARAMARRLSVENPWFPLLAGLLFAVHPITTESVNWISGRTDLLATSFVLLTTLAILRSSASRSYAWALAAAGLFVAAVMSKEISLFFFPAAIAFFWWHGNPRRHTLRAALAFASPFLLAGLTYVGLRMLTVSSRAIGVSDLLERWHYNLYDTIRVTFKVFGFYVKKLFVPVPLNFAIREVAEIYVLVGMLALALALWLIWKRVVLFWPFAVAFLLIAPGILVALTSVAWTPVAERYIYLSATFAVVGLTAGLLRLGRFIPARAVLIGLGLLLVSGTAVTAHRNYLWLDNERLFADTRQKSAGFAAIDNELGIALLKSGETEKAIEVLEAALAAGKGEQNPLIYVNLMNAYQRVADYANVDRVMQVYVAKNGYTKHDVLAGYARMLERKIIDVPRPAAERRPDIVTLIELYKKLYELKRDPFILYRSGQLELGIGHDQQAAETFAEVARRAPQDAYYRPAAEKLAARLGAADKGANPP